MKIFAVEFVREGQKDFHLLDSRIQPRVIKAFQVLAADPSAGKPLKGELAGRRSYRVGDYRIVYRVDLNSHAVVIHKIGHRRDVYRS